MTEELKQFLQKRDELVIKGEFIKLLEELRESSNTGQNGITYSHYHELCDIMGEVGVLEDPELWISAPLRFKDINSINIPHGVTKIRDSLFRGCRKLTNIILPDTVRTIEGLAFEHCTSLTNIKIPDNTTSIETCAFCGCVSLSDITFGTNLISIGEKAFLGCRKLSVINLPSNLLHIKEGAFYMCNNLTEVNITSNLQTIGLEVFENCPNLKTINYNGCMEQWHSIDNGNAESKTIQVVCTDGITTYGYN